MLAGVSDKIEVLWEKKRAKMVRADAEVYDSCFQGETKPDPECSFQARRDLATAILTCSLCASFTRTNDLPVRITWVWVAYG